MKICMVGEGAFAHKHLDALARIDGVEVASIAGGVAEHTRAAAAKYGIPHWTTDLDQGLSQPGVEAAILASPTPMHADQAERVMRAGKHVMIEIPMADSLADAERVVEVQRETGLVAMVDHVRRFNPSHQWVHARIRVRGTQVAAPGMRDVLLPPHQHERARPAPELDRPPAVAPRLPHRWISSSTRPARPRRMSTPSRVHRIPSSASPWT